MPFINDTNVPSNPLKPPRLVAIIKETHEPSAWKTERSIRNMSAAADETPSTGEHNSGVNADGSRIKSLADRRALGDARYRPQTQTRARNASPPAKTLAPRDGVGGALTDTPSTTAPNTAPSSPSIKPHRKDSASSTPRIHPTTLDIPGLTKSKVSPDGRIAKRDIGSKLVIVMVGLPARGKSYITKKTARYLNWLQHDTRIFNVGERRRVAAGRTTTRVMRSGYFDGHSIDITSDKGELDPTTLAAQILVNGEPTIQSPTFEGLPPPAQALYGGGNPEETPADEAMDQSAGFFDPSNLKAAQLREQVALATLDDLLDYILDQDGAVGIFDATNSTLERRQLIMKRVRERAGPELGVLFLESLCLDENLLESNMRLKLSGPDYKDQDPVAALEDFKKRVAMYEKKYVPLGEFEEKNDMQYVQMIDVGRKIVSHQIRGFLAAQAVYYLVNFNLSPRQIWITRHGETNDNATGKIGGNSSLNENGDRYAKALARFIDYERKEWAVRQQDKAASTHFPPLPGDSTPPNPEYTTSDVAEKGFCVWTSMLSRSIQTAQYFDEEEFELKQMKMLDELNAGDMEGMTYGEIREKYPAEYELRRRDKLQYRYPGAGGEGYLDIINRLRAVIVEVERMTDHVLLVGHRSVARVLLAYFRGLQREDVAHLDVPLGTLYSLEPKPYGVDFKAFRYNPSSDWFEEEPSFELQRARSQR
ncbi:MAG: hypothetical protein M1833_000223 [Piccolia ochrophora]|nr:MAG: hypothetical protein M1833_000223 [Piccolia ochrophora]